MLLLLAPAVGDLDAEAVLAEPQLVAGVLPLTIERSSAERAAPHVPDPCEIVFSRCPTSSLGRRVDRMMLDRNVRT
jgi:hypothetical protein